MLMRLTKKKRRGWIQSSVIPQWVLVTPPGLHFYGDFSFLFFLDNAQLAIDTVFHYKKLDL